MIQTNCVILRNPNREVLVFDPGSEAEKICDVVDELDGEVIAYPLTHGHYDHICALHEMVKRKPAPCTMHPFDLAWCYTSPFNHNPPFYEIPGEEDRAEISPAYEHESVITLGSFKFRTLFLPGHSPGSVGFYFEEDKFLVGGDVLFQGSIGRTDLPGGDHPTLMQSLRSLMELPDDVTVIPGHGPATTIGAERVSNPFVREALDH